MNYPTCVIGFNSGPARYESNMSEMLKSRFMDRHWHFLEKPEIDGDGKFHVLTHIQLKSRFFFFIFVPNKGFPWPMFHIGIFPKRQEQRMVDEGGGPFLKWIPRSERGLYTRFSAFALLWFLAPWFMWPGGIFLTIVMCPAFRWDYDVGMIEGEGFFGFHLD